MPTILSADAGDHACPYRNFEPCLGPKCMAWAWQGPAYERRETDNLQETPDGLRPVGEPPSPEGDGWQPDGAAYSKGYHRSDKDKLPKGKGQYWMRARVSDKGDCGRTRSGDSDFGMPF